MSGTSMDAVDAVLISISEAADTLKVLDYYSQPINQKLKNRILSLNKKGKNELERYARLDRDLGLLFGECAINLCKQNRLFPTDITAIGSHGQTIRHHPLNSTPFTIQIADPNIIAESTNITTVADFRRRDIAAGGEGAPLVPAFHQLFFSSAEKNRAIINIGGIANISYLPKTNHQNNACFGYDIGPGNMLMDYWIDRCLSKPYDKSGEWASSGSVNIDLLNNMLDDDYFRTPPPKSSGRDYFNAAWLNQKLSGFDEEKENNVQATLLALTTTLIKESLRHDVDQIFLCGGGAKNNTLMKHLQKMTGPLPVTTTSSLGIDPQHVEGAAFAWLAHRTMHRQTGSLPEVTGASGARILGGIYYS